MKYILEAEDPGIDRRLISMYSNDYEYSYRDGKLLIIINLEHAFPDYHLEHN